MLTNNTKELRLKLYRELEDVYHRFFNELAASDLPDGEVSKLTQAILLSRQEGLKHLLSLDEIDEVLEGDRENGNKSLN